MPRIGIPRSIAIAVLAVSIAACAHAQAQPALERHDCTIGTKKTHAICGSLQVFEDRRAGSGRTLDIHFVVLPATRPTREAIFWNPGGPGASATALAPFIADGAFETYLPKLRDRFDLVFVDNRGTGASHELRCTLFSRADPQSYFLQLWPDAALRSCRDRLAQGADLSDYATDYAADDLDDIRAALGYEKVVLNGDSGGTTFFLDYARRHPEHVESLLLNGVAPPHVLIIPLQDAAGAQLAADRVIAACRADARCDSTFPHLAAHFAALVRRFDRGPLTIAIQNTVTHRRQDVLLSKEVFADRLRQTMYSAATAAYVPFIIDRAFHGDYLPLGEMVMVTADGLDGLVPAGANLSVTCAEDIPFITEADVRKTSADSFMGDARVRAQQRACAIWNVQPVSAAFQQPVRTDAPVFMISGADDPTTPPNYSLEALAFMPNARRLLIANASHDDEVPCADALSERFIRAASAKHLDTASCAAAYRRPSFALSMQGFGD